MVEVTPEQKRAIRQHYERDAVIEEMLRVAEYREFSPTYPNGYGKRPDAINYESDFTSFVEKGAIAFHGSVERWNNPMRIDSADHDELRSGWDLIIDIDADAGMIYAKHAAELLIEELEIHGIQREDISVKFSGNRGFHLGIRQENFPAKIGGKPFSDWYPRLPQAIVGYLRDRIQEPLLERIRSEGVAFEDDDPDPFEVADVENDWGQRHLFRMPYSVNEKSMLVSLPIAIDDIMEFEKSWAEIEGLEVERRFLDSHTEGSGVLLAQEAIDWESKQRMQRKEEREQRREERQDYDLPDEAIPEQYFPAPIKRILSGLADGRKRAVFILATFLRHVGYDWEAIEGKLFEWNERNDEALPERYIQSQLSWHERQDEPLMPPNFDGKGWYRDIGVIDEDEDAQMLDNFDNPVPYAGVLQSKGESDDDEDQDDDGAADEPKD